MAAPAPVLAGELDKLAEYGFRIDLPSRWSEEELGYTIEEFGGSYQARFADEKGIAAILVVAADADRSKWANSQAWLDGVIINLDHRENLVKWYAGKYRPKYRASETETLKIGSGQPIHVTTLVDLDINGFEPNVAFAHLSSADGARWYCFMIYNKTRIADIHSDIERVLAGITVATP